MATPNPVQRWVDLLTGDIDVQVAVDWLNGSDCGAVELFLGTTRGLEDGKPIVRLDYEAYPSMAVTVMNEIIDEVAGDGSVARCLIWHRVGEVSVGKSSLLVGMATQHRVQGRHLVMEVVNRVKKRVPIWKKVVFEPTDGQRGDEKWSDKSEAFWLSAGDR